VGRLGIHGESIGVVAASYLANTFEVDFLFANRGISSLKDVARHNFGNLGYWLFKLSCYPDLDVS